VWLSSPHLCGLNTELARSRLTSLLCEMWRHNPAPLDDPRPALFAAVDKAWTTYEQNSSRLYQDMSCISSALILALFELRDVKKVSRQSELVRLELLSDQHALCLLCFLLEDALLAIPDGDGYVLAVITPDPTHHEFTLSFRLSASSLSKPDTYPPNHIWGHQKQGQGPTRHGAKPAPPRPILQPRAQPLYTCTRIHTCK
jgi:hypothetical protein